jgi:hypothetical protein
MRSGKPPKPNARLERERLLRDKLEECEGAFPSLTPEMRKWFNYYRQGKGFEQLPEDMQRAMRRLNSRLKNEFGARLPRSSPESAADGSWLADGAACSKARNRPAGAPYDKEMAAIVKADVVAFSSEITNYWAKLLLDHGAFQGGNRRAPSMDSESEDEKRLAYGHGCCLKLAMQGKLPFETELILKRFTPDFDLVGLWAQRLEMRGGIMAETGSIPSISIASQRNLSFWLYTVSNLIADGRLPTAAAWLSENFKPICALQGYLAFARSIGGEENIRPDLGIHEATRLSAWREEMRALHAEGGLSPHVIVQMKDSTKILGD